MTYYRKRENVLEMLLRWRRNVFLQSPGGGYVLVSATRFMLALHHFDSSVRHEPAATEHRDPIPGLFDGNGWNLALLNNFIQPEKIMSENQQPFAALYCKPLRASIRNLTDIELRVFVTLATYADDRGVCFPGGRALAEDTGLSTTEVSTALDGLKSKSFIYYLRYNQLDPITRKIMPNVYGLTATIMRLNSITGIQTYMFEFLNQVSPSQVAQPDSKNQYQELEPRTNSINHHHQPTPGNARRREMQEKTPGMENSGKEKGEGESPASPQPAAQPQLKDPENDVPPPDAGDLKAYTVPLPSIDQEAYANELHALVGGVQLAKARQLVQAYGIGRCMAAFTLLKQQPFGAVKSPSGWLITKLRQGALVPQDALTTDQRRWGMPAQNFDEAEHHE
jgi:hypothetical protein